MIYEIHYHGGRQDGVVAVALRPYFRLTVAGEVYEAREQPHDHEQWVSDDERRIDLYFAQP